MRPVMIVLAALGAVLLTACGSSSNDVVRAPSTSAAASTTTSTAASSSAVTSAAASSSATSAQTLTVTPATGLHDKQSVLVTGSGFSPGESLTVIECAAKQTATGPGDCNLTGMQGTAADSKGTATLKLTVLIGPFGTNNIVCSQQQPCLISMTQASLSPTEEADAAIGFATG